MLVAIVGNPRAAHQFHDEERPAPFSRSGIEDSGDIWMVHQRQSLPLRLEAGDDLFGLHPEFEYLQGNPAADGFGLFSHIYDPAPTLADFLQEPVAANPVPG